MSDSISLILLAGGSGTRMKSAMPKQFLLLQNKPLILHSLELFLHIPEIEEMIVVAPLAYHSLFSDLPVKLALPGERRQDSVYNGLQCVSKKNQWVLIHDGVRPFVPKESIQNLIVEGKKIGAATLAVPVKPTIKECSPLGLVEKTHERTKLWEIQTPQFLLKDLLLRGFDVALKENITVTDDTSLVELLSHPVKVVHGTYTNLKITTPEDLLVAETILNRLSSL